MPDTEIKHFQCRHIFTDGHRCGSKCLRHEDFCYYHHTTRRPKPAPDVYRDTHSSFEFPLPEDRSAIQAAIGIILQRIANGCLDSKRAGLLLYGLQIASLNLPKAPAAPAEPVEEVTIDDQNRTLAPIHELIPPEKEKSLGEIVMEQFRMLASAEPDAPGAPSSTGSLTAGQGGVSSLRLDRLPYPRTKTPHANLCNSSAPSAFVLPTVQAIPDSLILAQPLHMVAHTIHGPRLSLQPELRPRATALPCTFVG
jgi:hypothetical protein